MLPPAAYGVGASSSVAQPRGLHVSVEESWRPGARGNGAPKCDGLAGVAATAFERNGSVRVIGGIEEDADFFRCERPI